MATEHYLSCCYDSMLNQINENRLNKQFNIKVRTFPGNKISDMYFYLTPLLEKEPDYLVLHVSTNDAKDKSSDLILREIMQLKLWVENKLPSCKVTISHPILRLDDGKAQVTIRNLVTKLGLLNISMIDNSNITSKHLSRHGLHLSAFGTKKMAMNLISFVRGL